MSESEGMPERVAVSDDGGGYLTADREIDDVEGKREAVYVRADIQATAIRERDESRAEAERLREALRECVDEFESLTTRMADHIGRGKWIVESQLEEDMEKIARARALLAP